MLMASRDHYRGLSSLNIHSFDQRNLWCKVVSCKIVVGADQQAGSLEAYRIDRAGLHDCKAYFHYFMNKPNKALRDVALHLFDRHGHLKQHLYGTFGSETDPGGLIFIRTRALKRYHGEDIACQAIKQLLKQLNSQDRKEASWNLAVMRNEGMRLEGFRPISHSEYLGCCAAKDHKCWDVSLSRMIPLAENPMAAADESRDASPEASNSVLDQKLADAVRGADYHEDAAGYSTGFNMPVDMNEVKRLVDAGACADRCNAVHCAVAAEQEQCICYLLGRGADVNARDSKGSTPLHIAAHEGKPGCVKLLLGLGADTAVKDHMGYTPMDVCTLKMQSLRDIAGIAGTFTQHPASFMAVAQCLQQAGVSQQTTASLPQYKSKRGCTCGQCKSGFLSPRMRDRLFWTAEEATVMVFDSIDDCIPEWPCSLAGPTAVYSLYLFEYVPVWLRSEVSKEFAEGWLAVIEIIARLLEAGYVPTASQVAHVTRKKPSRYCQDPAAARHFLRNGGTVEFALDAILSWSRQEHEVIGNGNMSEAEEFLADHAKLVSCENDTDYNMVKKMLCNAGAEPVGPYHATCEDDCLAEGTDGDSESMDGSEEEGS